MFATALEHTRIPRGLDAMPPGPKLAAFLSTIDVETLNGRETIVFLRAQDRQASYDQARRYRSMARVVDLYLEEDPELLEFASAEIGAALTYTRRAADRELGLAVDLVSRYPILLNALETGDVDVAKVRVIVHGISHVDVEIGRRAIERILPDAPRLTTGQIAARLRRIVIEADPDEAKKAYEEGLAEAQIWSRLEPNGTGTMIATGLDAYDLSCANRRINRLARRFKNEGDPRPIDQIRASVFMGLLTGQSSEPADRAQCNITASLDTLTRLAEKPGDLEGFGPVIADIARQIFEQQKNAAWTFTVTDQGTGQVYVGTTSRRPTTSMRRRLTSRYPTCVHPGCRMPAARCDLDHTEGWAEGGKTTLCNLAPLCRFHHRMKHSTRWTYHRLLDGTIEWVSQFGFRYLTHPP